MPGDKLTKQELIDEITDMRVAIRGYLDETRQYDNEHELNNIKRYTLKSHYDQIHAAYRSIQAGILCANLQTFARPAGPQV